MATTALITGGTSGIGRATANKLAQLGVHVVVVGRNVDRGEKTIAEIRKAGGQADFIPSDLRDASSARVVARKALEVTNGQVDILVNNAGVYPFGPTHEMTEASFDEVYSVNVKASYFLVAELAPLMAKRGKGAIVNLSTMVADYGAPGMSLYGSSKAAINLLTKGWMAAELLSDFSRAPVLDFAPLARRTDHPANRAGTPGHEVRFWQCAPKARITSGGRFHPESCRLIW